MQLTIPTSLLSTGAIGNCNQQSKQTGLKVNCLRDVVSLEPSMDVQVTTTSSIGNPTETNTPLETQPLSHTNSSQETMEATPIDSAHLARDNQSVQETKAVLTNQTEPPSHKSSSSHYTDNSQSKLGTEKIDNNPKLKRVRRRPEEEGGGADGDRLRVKRQKRKGQRSEQAVDSAIQEELEKHHKQSMLKILSDELMQYYTRPSDIVQYMFRMSHSRHLVSCIHSDCSLSGQFPIITEYCFLLS